MLDLNFKTKNAENAALTQRRITIGRDPSNTVVLQESGISGFHAEIQTENGHSYLVDLGSKNGCLINGNRVQGRQEIKPWDVIRFDKVEAEVVDTESRRPTKVNRAISDADLVAAADVGKTQVRPAVGGWMLEARSGALAGKLFPISGKRVVGTHPDCDIVIAGAHVSRRHAEVALVGGQLKVKDLGSSNGTFVNDDRVSEATLRAGDVVRFDQEQFVIVDPAADAAATRVRQAVGGSGTQVMEVPKAKLVASDGNSYILSGSDMTVGREPDNDIVLDHSTVSGNHARLICVAGDWRIEDALSTNGTFVNDKRITSHVVSPGDTVRFGKVALRFELLGVPVRHGTEVMSAIPDGDGTATRTSVAPAVKKDFPSWAYGVIAFLVVGIGAGAFLFKGKLTGKPPVITAQLQVAKVWQVALPEGRSAPVTPAIADINGDGVLDVVIGDGNGYVLALDGKTGKKIFDVPVKDKVLAPIVTGKLTGNGISDIVVATNSGIVVALNGEGKTLWRSSGALNLGAVWNRPVLHDLNGDGVPDVVVPTTNKGLVALDGSHGWELWNTADFTHGKVITSPVSGDFNKDGVEDFAFATDEHQVLAVSATKKRVWKLWAAKTPGKVLYSSPLYIRAGDKGLVVVLTDRGPVAFRADNGRLAWATEIDEPFFASPLGVDANGDGVPDVVAISRSGDIHVLDSLTGNEIWSAKVGADVDASPAAMDVNNDGVKDLVILDKSGRLSVFDMARGRPLLTFQAAKPITTVSGSSPDGYIASPVMGDLSDDSLIEVVTASMAGKIDDYEINRATYRGSAAWPVFLGNDQHALK